MCAKERENVCVWRKKEGVYKKRPYVAILLYAKLCNITHEFSGMRPPQLKSQIDKLKTCARE